MKKNNFSKKKLSEKSSIILQFCKSELSYLELGFSLISVCGLLQYHSHSFW